MRIVFGDNSSLKLTSHAREGSKKIYMLASDVVMIKFLSLFFIVTFSLLYSCREKGVPDPDIKTELRVDKSEVSSVRVFSGRKRIKVSWHLKPDASVSKVKVYWNDKVDSRVQK